MVEEAITHTPREVGNEENSDDELVETPKNENIEDENKERIKAPKEKVNKKKPVKKAETESTDKKVEKSLEEKKKDLLKKAEELKKKIAGEGPTTEELKEQVKGKKKEPLLPLDDYVKSGIYLGTKVVTPDMRQYVYRRRADGLAIFNTDIIDDKLKEGIEYLSKFDAKDIVLVCKRLAGWKAAEMFSKATGIRNFRKKYPAGILTNTDLPDFFENELTIITDAWLDKNALADTLKVHKKVLMICDTNNFSRNVDQVVIGNNKSPKSLGLIFYLLARGYCKAKNIDADIPDLEEWTSGEE